MAGREKEKGINQRFQKDILNKIRKRKWIQKLSNNKNKTETKKRQRKKENTKSRKKEKTKNRKKEGKNKLINKTETNKIHPSTDARPQTHPD